MERVALVHVYRKECVSPCRAGRSKLPFRAVNTREQPGYQPDMQRHHLLPRQLLGTGSLGEMLAQLGKDRIGFDDFRRNGLLLPASTGAALRAGLPLHCGPHADYNAMVLERVGQIEGEWSRTARRDATVAAVDAIARLDLLQRAWRRRLLEAGRGRLLLSRKDPFHTGQDFSHLDAMVDQLWAATEPPG